MQGLKGNIKGRKAIEVDEERFELLYNAWQAGKSTHQNYDE